VIFFAVVKLRILLQDNVVILHILKLGAKINNAYWKQLGLFCC